MCCLKHDRRVFSPAVGNNNNGDNESEHVEKDDAVQKEVGSANKFHIVEGKRNLDLLESNGNVFLLYQTEKAKWEPLSVLSKLEGDKDRKTGK